MANLFEIDRALLEAWERCVDPETGEIDEALYAEFEALQLKRDQKIENVACWIKNLASDAEAMKAEAKNLTERAKAAEKKAESLKHYLELALHGEKFSGTRAAISFRRSKAVRIAPDTTLPVEYIRRKVTEEPDKTAIKAALAAGNTIEGCELVETVSLQIK